MIPLTPEQKVAVEYPGSLCLTSCPGSGKTRAIVAKLLRCADEVRDTPRRVACITFTNAAVKEIESRLRKYGSPEDVELCEISTIHSFCLNHILRPFSHLVPQLAGGWNVVNSEDEWIANTVRELMAEYDIHSALRESFEQFQRRYPDGFPYHRDIPDEAVREFFRRADAAGKVTLGDIVFYSAKIVQENEFIANALASRFAWYVVDEFQDTTASQCVILEKILQQGRSRIFFVGDPNQSILSFAGAHPALMPQFSANVGARNDCRLTGNFRSSTLIVDHAELLCGSNPRMAAVGEWAHFNVPPQHVACATPFDGIFDHFLPALDNARITLGNAAVLAPWWTDLLRLGRELRQRDVAILGPGSRPYRRSHEFAMIAEALAAYLGSPSADRSAALQKAFFIALGNANEVAPREIYRYSGKRVVFTIVAAARNILAHHEGVTEWLVRTAGVTEDILIREGMLTKAQAGIFIKSARSMLAEMESNGVDVTNMPATELGMIADPANCMSLLTMHQAKGREFEAVAVISVHEGRVPHFTAETQEEFDEARRLLYVAATRAKKLLMYFTDATHRRNEPSRFLRQGFAGLC